MSFLRAILYRYCYFCCLGESEESDELTSFSGEMPLEVRMESITVTRYVNEDYFFAMGRTVVETTHIDPQADCGSGQVMETKASTPDNASDTNTLVESPKTETVRSASSFQPDEIEAPFGYHDLKFCASVPFGYVKARAGMDAAVAD